MSFISYEYREKPDLQIPVNHNKINQILGINISEKEYLNYLKSLVSLL